MRNRITRFWVQRHVRRNHKTTFTFCTLLIILSILSLGCGKKTDIPGGTLTHYFLQPVIVERPPIWERTVYEGTKENHPMEEELNEALKSRGIQESLLGLVTKYTPPRITELVNEENMAINTYYYEVPQNESFDYFTLEMLLSSGIEVTAYMTTFEDIENTSESGWKDVSELIFGESVLSITGPIHEIFYQWRRLRARLLFKIAVTGATNTVRVNVTQY